MNFVLINLHLPRNYIDHINSFFSWCYHFDSKCKFS